MAEDEITKDELDEVDGEQLPDREAMSILPMPLDPTGGAITLPVEPPATE